MVRVSARTTNRSFIHGDFDRDGVANIDDKYPFSKRKSGRVNDEVSLSKTINYVRKRRTQAKKTLKKFKKKHPKAKGRVKDVYSTINKAVRRNPGVTNDFIGIRFEGKKRADVKKKWQSFNKKQGVKKKVFFRETIGPDNKYKSNKGTKNLYRAYHSNFVLGGFGAEAQFRTKKYGKLNDNMHTAYKKGKPLSPFKRKSKLLLKGGY